jgi:glycerol-1-phosphate dehydrogenase [NAD(P)+]
MGDIDNWKAVYGSGVIARECCGLNSYVALTSPSAWHAVAPLLPEPPVGRAFVTGQEEKYLLDLLRNLPQAEQVLAVGGGKALDAGKFVAWKRNLPYVLIPTIVSTGSVFQPFVPTRRNNKVHMIVETGPPECVLFDADVIRAAPPHLNAAGMAECICWLGSIASWRWWSAAGLSGPCWDEEVASETRQWVRQRVSVYASDLDLEGRPGERGIRAAAEVNRERSHLRLSSLKASHPLCHIFENTFLWTHGRDLHHGEGVALGTLIGCYFYGWGFDEAKEHLGSCGTRFRPREIGCTWDEVLATFSRIPEHSDHLGWPETFFHHRSVSHEAFAGMARRIDAG